MAIIKKVSKSQFINDYDNFLNNCDGYDLDDVYTSYSQAKANAYLWCREKFFETPNSECFRIISHNSMMFTCGWFGDYVDEKTGEVFRAFFKETHRNSYITLYCK